LASSIVILGGGFGGLTVANELRRRIGKEHRITLIDKNAQFLMGLAKLGILSGQRIPNEGLGDMKSLERKGIGFVHSEITRIDASSNKVTSEAGDFAFDFLVIALGADLSPKSVPGFLEGALDFYTPEGAARLSERVQKLNEGKLVVLISSTPFKCPSAPYEAAMLMDDLLRKRGVRDRIDIQIFTPESQPLPAGGPAVGEQVKALLSERSIGFNPMHKAKAIDAKGNSITFENGNKAAYDLLAGVPAHSVPRVVRDSGLAGPSGWIPVDKKTLITSSKDVYAIGDVASVMMANNLPMPKLGILAEEEAKVVAENIASAVLGASGKGQFEGRGGCFIEVGSGKAAIAKGEFLLEPAPKIFIDPPSHEGLEMKKEFEASRMASWF
jgi:sulfide:quinone oxidoreductase